MPIIPTTSSAIDKTRPTQFVSIRAGQGPSDTQTYDLYKPAAPSRSDLMTSDSRPLHYKASRDLSPRPDPRPEAYTERRNETVRVANQSTQSQDLFTSRPNEPWSSLPTNLQVPALVRTAQPNTSDPKLNEPRLQVTRTTSSDSPKYSPHPPSLKHTDSSSAPQMASHGAPAKTIDPRIAQHPTLETSNGNRTPQVPSSRPRHQSDSEMMSSNRPVMGPTAPPINQRAVSRDGPVGSRTPDLAIAQQSSLNTTSNTVSHPTLAVRSSFV